MKNGAKPASYVYLCALSDTVSANTASTLSSMGDIRAKRTKDMWKTKRDGKNYAVTLDK